jgi:hypothetical protein
MTHMQPFFAALQQIILDGEPAPVRKPSYLKCRGCGGTGELESGRACMQCSLGDDWDGVIAGEKD